MSRMRFLRGGFGTDERPIRPPWAVDEDAFVDRCSRCNKCIDACEQRILRRGSGGFPVVDFGAGECTFCRRCAQVCSDGVLRDEGAPWALAALVTDACLAQLGISCRSCVDACSTGALRFRLQLGGRARAEIDPHACSGCGACYRPCPVAAVRLNPTATAATTEGA